MSFLRLPEMSKNIYSIISNYWLPKYLIDKYVLIRSIFLLTIQIGRVHLSRMPDWPGRTKWTCRKWTWAAFYSIHRNKKIKHDENHDHLPQRFRKGNRHFDIEFF